MEIRELNYADEEAFLEGLKLWEGEDLSWYTFSWKRGVSFTSHVDQLTDERSGAGLPEGWVPATMLYGFVNGEIVGRVNIRHHLNDNLLKRGGHIGYAVAPKHRRKGYAKKLLNKALDYCFQELGLERVLISCASDNVPSTKLIEGVGGQLSEEVFDDVDEEMIRKYWVSQDLK